MHAIGREIGAIDPASWETAIRALVTLAAREPGRAVHYADALAVISMIASLRDRIAAARPLIEHAAAGLDGAPAELREIFPTRRN